MKVDTCFLTHGIPTRAHYHEIILAGCIFGDLLGSRDDVGEVNSLDINIGDSTNIMFKCNSGSFEIKTFNINSTEKPSEPTIC